MAVQRKMPGDETVGNCKRLKSGHDWPQVQPWVPDELVELLDQKSGIKHIERFLFKAQDVLDSPEVAQKAADVVQREGIVLLAGALSKEQVDDLKGVFPELIQAVRQHDPNDEGSRGEKRHSFGGMSSTNSQLHHAEFRELIDVPAVTKVLEAYWGSSDFAVSAAGGDLNMAGSQQHQRLHTDCGKSKLIGQATAVGTGVKAPMIAVNYLIEPQTPFNGPLQHIPRTQLLEMDYLPQVCEEPEVWFYSTMSPAEPGTAVIRDIRAWHAGTPNLTTKDRPLPNCEFIAPSVAMNEELRKKLLVKPDRDATKQMTYETWDTLPESAKHLTRFIHGEPGAKVEPTTIYSKIEVFGQECSICPLFKRFIEA